LRPGFTVSGTFGFKIVIFGDGMWVRMYLVGSNNKLGLLFSQGLLHLKQNLKCFNLIIAYLDEWNYFFQLSEVWGWISLVSQLSNYTCVFFHLRESFKETHYSTFEGTIQLLAQAECYFPNRHP
jgi:hypothetical protein